ncbi:MAG: histidine--tRNA ligase [Phycisphaerae bacterium]|nr:histidine--tRNA ligase [Phycisphaerae bacterium]
MKFRAAKGTRDFYPDAMRLRTWLTDAWRRVSLRNGFEEYDGPIFEHLELYTTKSGDEIASQLFDLEDRGGRRLAIRPEMTPTLGRMVNARAQSLPRPIKWFSVPRLCRAERPQKGRLREFFQWNIDIVGVDDVLADAESILVAVDFLREVGLGPEDAVVRINSRRLVAAVLADLRVPPDRMDKAYALLDKAGKIPRDALQAMWKEAFGDAVPFDAIEPLLGVEGLDHLHEAIRGAKGGWAAAERELPAIEALFEKLDSFGITEYCNFDMAIVRGLAYYTGVVYEVFDRGQAHRAIGGGGRYDNLLRDLGGPAMPGVGFGVGDVVITDVLTEAGKLPVLKGELDVYVIAADAELQPRALELVAQLRRGGWSTDFSYRAQSVGKLLRAASDRGARRAVIVGQETRDENLVTIKDLTTGQQTRRDWAAFVAAPLAAGDEGDEQARRSL